MTEEELMKAINDAGYELDKRTWKGGQEYVCFRPKRKQTGWICHGCSISSCIRMTIGCQPTECPFYHYPGECHWKPFYGKVVV